MDHAGYLARLKRVDDCLIWTGSRSTAGYGNMKMDGKVRSTHRYAYELTHGSIPPGLVIDHLCRNRACCNPAHLEAVTLGENTRRGLVSYAIRDSCARGHDITDPANVYVAPDGGHRQCWPCRKIAKRAWDAHRSAA